MSDQSVVKPMSATEADLALVGLGAIAISALAGCGGGGGGGGAAVPAAPANTITSLTFRDSTGAPVTVEAIAGTASGVKFDLDGGKNATSKPLDPGANGAAQAYTFAAANATGSAAVGITINPAPADVASVLGRSLTDIRAAVSAMAFAPSWDELMSYVGLTQAQIVDRVVGRMKGAPAEDYPSWFYRQMLSQAEYAAQGVRTPERRAEDTFRKEGQKEFKAWFFRQAVTSPDPLSERLLLFWHNLWTSGGYSHPQIIARQSATYRKMMGGHLGDFIKAMTRDPLMIMYLDSGSSSKNRPNENFARELMELFTLGERTAYQGYEETDIAKVALCFTGYRYSDHYDQFIFNGLAHDTATPINLWGVDRVASSAPGADGDWVIDQILAKRDADGHSYCAVYIVTRLWREFIGDPADNQPAIKALADRFADTDTAKGTAMNWNLTELYRALFNHREFTATAVRGTRIRAPFEMFVAFYRALGVQPKSWRENIDEMTSLDQDLFHPPTVFGWPGGKEWINVKNLVSRNAYMLELADTYGGQVAEKYADVLTILLAPIAPVNPIPAGPTAARVAAYVSDPVFNLR